MLQNTILFFQLCSTVLGKPTYAGDGQVHTLAVHIQGMLKK